MIRKADATGAEVTWTTTSCPRRADRGKFDAVRPPGCPELVGDRLPDASSTAARSARVRTSTAANELGKFIADPESNDAFAQAFVNRMWGHLLGRGFVHPVDDFGTHNPPSHPELLDPKLGQGFPEERLRRQGPDPLDHRTARRTT